MQIPPKSVLATFPPANYVNPEQHPPAASIVNLILYPLCVIVIALRIFSRARVSKSFGVDDVLIIVAMFPASAFMVISVLAELKYGWDRHVWDVPKASIQLGLQLILTAECLFAASCTLTKLSMLVFLNRIMGGTNGPFRKIIYAAMIIIALQGITFCFIVVFQCNPVSDYWKLTFDVQTNCFNQPINLLVAGIVNTLTDFAVVMLPIPVVLGLKLPRRQQVIIVCLFGAGFIVCIAGIVRTYFMYEVSETYDQTWVGFSVWVTGAVELYVAILCSAIPALKPLFSRYLPELMGSTVASISKSQAPGTSGTMTGSFRAIEEGHEFKDMESPPRAIYTSHSKRPRKSISTISEEELTDIESPTRVVHMSHGKSASKSASIISEHEIYHSRALASSHVGSKESILSDR